MNCAKIVVITVTLFFFIGCTSTYQPPISSQQKQSINNLHVLFEVERNELGISFEPTNGFYPIVSGGFVAGAIAGATSVLVSSVADHFSAKKAEKTSAPYREMLTGYNITDDFYSQLYTSMARLSWANASNFTSIIGQEEFKATDFMATISDDALLVVQPYYALSPTLEILKIHASVTLYEKHQGPEPMKVIYRNYYHFQSPKHQSAINYLLPEQAALAITTAKQQYEEEVAQATRNPRVQKFHKEKLDREIADIESRTTSEHLYAFSKMPWDSSSLKEALATGVKQISHLILTDLTDQRSPESYGTIEEKIATFHPPSGLTKSTIAYHLSPNDDYEIYRLRNGTMYAIPQGQMFEAYQPLP